MDKKPRPNAMDLINLPILILDIDGVIVFEVDKHENNSSEVIILHKNIGESLLSWRQRIFFVTHRSRREAKRILELAGIPPSHYIKLIAAEDLFQAALDAGQIRDAIKHGLLKSFALPLIERISWQGRENMVMLDDRQHNLDAMLKAGLKLVLKAPIDIDRDHNVITSFDLTHTLKSLSAWHQDRALHPQIELAPTKLHIEASQRSGITTKRLQRHPFNAVRRMTNSVRRRKLFRASPREA